MAAGQQAGRKSQQPGSGGLPGAQGSGNSGAMGKLGRDFDPQVVAGALVGVAAALALIGWVLARF